MMTSIIVEDIQMAADFLRKFCEKSGLVEVKGHFLNVADALAFLDKENVDLIVSDKWKISPPGLGFFEPPRHGGHRGTQSKLPSATPTFWF